MGVAGKLKSLCDMMVADPLPPDRVAAGWALGMFVGCAIPFGMQLVISVPLAVLLRVSKIGASVGTLITNPVSIFFIYPAQTYAINKLFFGGSLSYSKLQGMEWTWDGVKSLGMEAVVCFFLGGLVLGSILAPTTYFLVKKLVICKRRYLSKKASGCGSGDEKEQ